MSRASLAFDATKRGAASLVAVSAPARVKGKMVAKTMLKEVSHKAPTRLLPLRSAAASKRGASIVSLSSYGGGLLQGDRSDVTMEVARGQASYGYSGEYPRVPQRR